MSFRQCLFVGGEADGQRNTILDSRRSVYFAVQPNYPAHTIDYITSVEYKTIEYIRATNREDDLFFNVFVTGDMTRDKHFEHIIKALIDGCRPPKTG